MMSITVNVTLCSPPGQISSMVLHLGQFVKPSSAGEVYHAHTGKDFVSHEEYPRKMDETKQKALNLILE